jgi:hypothetical protein
MEDLLTWKDMAKYIRTCQCCNLKQETKDVATYKTDSWKDLKCRRCGNDALDYGSWRHAKDCTCQYCMEDEE